jgi:hypothetical protein
MAFPVVLVVASTYLSSRQSSHLSDDELLYSLRLMTTTDGATGDEDGAAEDEDNCKGTLPLHVFFGN